jgi:hypothetical protein
VKVAVTVVFLLELTSQMYPLMMLLQPDQPVNVEPGSAVAMSNPPTETQLKQVSEQVVPQSM